MFSYEDRLRAVQLYIKLGKRIGLTIRQLGYPTKNALLSWHREYEQRLDLPAGYVRQPRYSQADKARAVRHYLDHGRWAIHRGHCCPSGCTSSIRRSAHASSVDPGSWLLQPSNLLSSPCACDQPARRWWLNDLACLEVRCTSGRINCSATTHPHP